MILNKTYIFFVLVLLITSGSVCAQPKQPTVRDMMQFLEEKHDVKFVYDSGLDMNVIYSGPELNSANVDKNLRKVFRDSNICWARNGKYVVLTKSLPPSLEGQSDTLMASRVISGKILRQSSQTGLSAIDGSSINRGYAVLSSPDLIKTLQSYTGVQSGTEMLSGLYVHGGTGRDNLFLLDGVPLYQANHLAGFFSSFNTDVIGGVDFYKSGFPARYGGRLSSVVDVSVKDGDFNRLKGLFSIGLLDGRFQLEGPIVKGKTSFNFSLRRSWIDLITHPYFKLVKRSPNSNFSLGYSFHDLNFKLVHKFSDGNKLSLNVFNGYDGFRYNETSPGSFGRPNTSGPGSGGASLPTYHAGNDESEISMNWGNIITSLNWNCRINDRLGLRALLYWNRSSSMTDYHESKYSWDEDTFDYNFITENETFLVLDDISAKADFLWIPHESHSVRFGGQYIFHTYRPERNFKQTGEMEKGDDYIKGENFIKDYQAHESAVYVEDEMHLLKWLDLTAGLRYSVFSMNGKTWNGLEPRVSANVRFNEDMALKASYVEMNQYTHGMASTAADLPMNFWMPSTKKVKPMYSRQFATEFMMNLPWNMHLEMGGFYRTLDNIHEYAGTNHLFPNMSRWETDFVAGKGLAYGAEAALGWTGKKIDMNLYYTLSWSKRKFEDFYPDWYYDRNDSRHKITFDFTYRISRKIDLHASWNYHTGYRATCYSNYLGKNDAIDGFPERFSAGPGNMQLPDYHRLDLGANFRRITKRGNESIWNVSIYNAYCRMNAVFITDWVVGGDGYLSGKAAAIFPILPSFSYTLKF